MRSPRGVLAACCLAMLSIGVVTNVPALGLTAIAEELALDSARSGMFLSCAFWGLVVSIPLAGPAADRWGFRHLLVGSGALQASGMYMVSHAQGTWQACLGAGICGLGTGVLDALLTPLACAVYPQARARTVNLLHAFYPIGMFLLVLAFLVLSRLQWNWREIYRLMMVTNVPYVLFFGFIRLPRHSHEGLTRLRGRQLIQRGTFLLLLAAIFLAGVTELGPSQWLPAYVELAAGSTRSASAIGLLLLGLMMALGRLGNSLLARHVSPQRLVVVSATCCVVSLVLAAIPAATVFTFGCLGMLGLSVSGIWPLLLSLAGNRFPEGGASMYSLLSTSGNLGGLVGPLAIGLVAQGAGLRLAIAALALAPAMVLLLLALDRKIALPQASL